MEVSYVIVLLAVTVLPPGVTAGTLPPGLRTGCVRQEYRTLTYFQRHAFHSALNQIKASGVYDRLALLHGHVVYTAHGGPGFLGWHRLYLLYFESALQKVEPSVCLPYWDSTIESEVMLDSSHIWSSRFLGTPRGKVVDGPFANWSTPFGDHLERRIAVGNMGHVFTQEEVSDYLSYAQTKGQVDLIHASNHLERHHGGVHVAIGGHMADVVRSASDPVFLLHHTFVDYLWEQFRQAMRRRGHDPELYPDIQGRRSFWGGPIQRQHAANASLFLHFGLTHADAYRDDARPYAYLDPPTCSWLSPRCPDSLRCHNFKCMSEDIEEHARENSLEQSNLVDGTHSDFLLDIAGALNDATTTTTTTTTVKAEAASTTTAVLSHFDVTTKKSSVPSQTSLAFLNATTTRKSKPSFRPTTAVRKDRLTTAATSQIRANATVSSQN